MIVTRRIEFDYGHRLLRHESKCRFVHGHRGVVEVSCFGHALDSVGRVVDFGVIKAKVGAWVDENWDHAFLVQRGDPLADLLAAQDQRLFLLDDPPTAEVLANTLLEVAERLLNADGLRVVRVRFWETPNNYAEVSA